MTLLKYGNAKLHNTLVFNLPAGMSTCNRECPGCYAMKFQRLYPNVLPYRNRMLEASQQSDFVSRISADIASCRKPFKYIRIHESGEFYSQQYIDKWYTIARSFAQYTFYTYTKRLKDFDFTRISSLPNFVLIDSLMHGGLNYNRADKLTSSVFTCPATTSKSTRCGIDCSYCMSKSAQTNGVQFVRH